MGVRIRLQRKGRIRLPIYRVVVCDSRCRRDGRFLEILGQYDPKAGKPGEQHTVTVNAARVQYWLSVGAQPSETVLSLMRQIGVIAPLEKKVERERPAGGKLAKKKGAAKAYFGVPAMAPIRPVVRQASLVRPVLRPLAAPTFLRGVAVRSRSLMAAPANLLTASMSRLALV